MAFVWTLLNERDLVVRPREVLMVADDFLAARSVDGRTAAPPTVTSRRSRRAR